MPSPLTIFEIFLRPPFVLNAILRKGTEVGVSYSRNAIRVIHESVRVHKKQQSDPSSFPYHGWYFLFYVHQQADIAQNARIDVSVSFEEDSRSCSIRCFFDATFETWWRIPIFELAVPLKRLVYSFFRASFVYLFFSLIFTYSFLSSFACFFLHVFLFFRAVRVSFVFLLQECIIVYCNICI